MQEIMRHDKEYFYKYVTAETALLILQNHTLKYSSPAIFNDPFDTQTKIAFGFELAEFMDKFTDELYRMAHDEAEPVGNDANALFRDIKAWWNVAKNSSKKMPKDIFKEQTRALADEAINWCNRYIEDMNSWWIRIVKASRVFCVAENCDNLLMWAHYAKNHTGLVIKFKCLPEVGTPLCAASKVKYVENPPIIAKMEEYIKHITGQSKLNYDSLLFDMFLTKSKHWEYENEWRVFIPPINMDNPLIPMDNNGNEILQNIVPLNPKEIYSIYFGCKMSEPQRQQIEKILVGEFARVKKYKCIRNEKEYKLDFEEIT